MKILYPVESGFPERKGQTIGYMFFCPGCQCGHQFNVLPADKHIVDGKWDGTWEGPVWTFDGNMERPTFSPSLLGRWEEMTEAGKADHKAWCEAGYPPREGKPFESRPVVCHSFVRNGEIQFLHDCTHKFAGQTVPLPEF